MRRSAAVVIGAAVVLTGCSFRGSLTSTSTTSARATGSSSASSSAHAETGATGTTATTSTAVGRPAASTSAGGQTARCHTGDLAASLVPGSPGAGQRYAVLALTNISGRTCTVDGYGGIGLADSSGAALPTTQVRVSSPAPQLVTLLPGKSARSQLHWGALAGPGDAQQGDCQPTPAALRVIPPDETTSLSVAWTQGPVCEQGTIDQNAYAAG